MVSGRFRSGYGFLGALALAVSLLFLVGCGGGGGGEASGAASGEVSVVSRAPGIAADSSSIDFGNQVIGQTAERAVTLTNTGTADLEIGAITGAGGVFAVTGNCANTTLAPTRTCSMVVRFTPDKQDDFKAGCEVESNAGKLPISLAGAGKGLRVGISNLVTNCADKTVDVKVIVSNFNNAPVPDLLEGNFALRLNGAQVAPSAFSAITVDQPVSVALALDWSNSFINSRPAIRDSSKTFIGLLNDADRAGVFRFALAVDGNAQPFIDVGTGRVILEGAVDKSFSGVTKPTYIWDAVNQVVGETARETNEKRAVILLTDGFDNGSTTSLDSLIANARAGNVVIFAIGLGSVNPGALERLAQETGGVYFTALTTDNLASIYQQISLILTNQYELSFANPSPTTAGMLQIGVSDSFGWVGETSREIPACP